MATVTLEQFLPEVLPESEGVPTPTAVNALRNACFDFCRKSLAINEVSTPADYFTGVQTYDIQAPSWAQVVAVLSIVVDDKATILPWSLEDVLVNRPSWASAQGAITGFVQPTTASVAFVAVPDADGVFTPYVAYAPTRTTDKVDARLFNTHLETIKYGALWKLKAMATRAWADPQGAAYYEGRFWMGVGAATIARNKGNSTASQRVTPVRFI